MRTRTNQFNVEWAYAAACATACQRGEPFPEPPLYQVYEVDEKRGGERLIEERPINVMEIKMSCGK